MMLTVQQAAERAAVSESLVYAWVADGTLPHTRLGRKGKRGTIRIDPADLDGVLAAFKVGARPAPPPPVKPVKLRHLRQPS
ncbi:MAG TPA: helix-turn-helix domain-containing protein [Urbifossiella sp.]|nr:helix-turn-helix domain-containing protein [Urbifossiella sp.]